MGNWVGGSDKNTIILGAGVGVVTKCSVQESFVIKIVYTVQSECLFFFKLFLGRLSILTHEI